MIRNTDTEVTKTEQHLRNLLTNSAQPQEGSLKNSTETIDYRDIRRVFPVNEPRGDADIFTGAQFFSSPNEFRKAVRRNEFVSPTNGICPGRMQCNLIVLEEEYAFDFLLFCQKNPRSCPLVEVCDVGVVTASVAEGSDLRTDISEYCIYQNGKLLTKTHDATPYWPPKSVAFLIGCSFSYDGALLNAGIPLRSVEQKKNVPMYKTNVPCHPAGRFGGHVVVSMKPIKAVDVAKEVLITSKYSLAHGAPLCVGCPESIGIHDLNNPDWGDSVDILPDEVPVFHYCGVTPQQVLIDSGVPFFISHSPGHMFVTDLSSNYAVV
ncbi:hypothetical protein ACHAW6_006184 [Cyclotella cf. meneghiniana]